MFRSTLRATPRRIASPGTTLTRSSARRSLSTAPPSQKSRSWKSSAARWGLAGAGVYYYNTSNVFAEEPEAAIQKLDESLHNIQESREPTVDAIVEEKRRRQSQAAAEAQQKQGFAEGPAEGQDGEEEGGMEGLEDEADQQGAFNPETGEINWDCPCLGGMAHGPCGEEFKAAFSCFVYSSEEPKGVECIDKFKGMQDCFRQHPEMYGSELEDIEDEVVEELPAKETASRDESTKSKPTQETSHQPSTHATEENIPTQGSEEKKAEVPQHDARKANAEASLQSISGDEGGELVSRASHDTTKSV
ncbi:related to rabbit histidine-rich calcium-binding protein [Rhynchosporium agropyri]|uniref:Mitochondrial intermembrane space import and assembly protein 40 n=1 Tax=Rhynchosporium agropyri TaxID=914238 RepID=A0A1E1JUA8_9HELO|nr:related to rabbit histidine-rich calcium-binding protein [Rhynchosporium agropyri]